MFVADQMEQALTALQTVKPFDYAGAYYAAYSGISALDPRTTLANQELIYGRTLALRVWQDRMRATLALEKEAADRWSIWAHNSTCNRVVHRTAL